MYPKKKANNLEDLSTKKLPTFIIWIFITFFGFAGLGLISQVQNGEFQPFGFIENILAQVGVVGRPAPNTGEILAALKTGDTIQESLDRCNIVDPNRDPEIMSVRDYTQAIPKVVDSMAGLNVAPDYTGSIDMGLDNKINDAAIDMGMSYTLAMFTSPNAVGSAADYVMNANKNDLFPIVRLCYIGNCGFKSADDIASFYKALSLRVGSDDTFIAMVGSNEPGTGTPSEMSGFGVSDYNSMVAMTVSAAEQLQEFRVIQGGNMYLSPGAFNLTNEVMNDVENYLSSPTAESFPDLFDYLMGNVYALGYPMVQTPKLGAITKGYDFYLNGPSGTTKGLGTWAQENNMPVIITEFGIMLNPQSNDREALIEEAKLTFKEFCNDDTVEGVLFFRPIPGMYVDQQEHQPVLWDAEASKAKIVEIIGKCSKTKNPLRDYAWQNCNLDSCLYDFSYAAKSVATTCGVEAERETIEATAGPALQVNCDGASCYTKKIDTLQIAAPIKQFGSNSATGTVDMPFTPACVEASEWFSGTEVGNTMYDAFNQFAGEIKLVGTTLYSPASTPTSGGTSKCGGSPSSTFTSVTPTGSSVSVAVLSDSLGTYAGFMPTSLFPNVNKSVGAIGGKSVTGYSSTDISIVEAVANLNTDAVYIQLGTNDFGNQNAASFGSGYKVIIDKIKSINSDAKIFVGKIPFVNVECACKQWNAHCTLTQEQAQTIIEEYNAQISSLAGVTVIENSVYRAQDLSFLEDGIHILDAAYAPMNNEIGSALGGSSTSNASSNTSTSTTSNAATTTSSTSYPMPWLGNAINCSAAMLALSTTENPEYLLNYEIKLNPGSAITESINERNQDSINLQSHNDSNYDMFPSVAMSEDVSGKVIDELAFCVEGEATCFDKSNPGDRDEFKKFRIYNPLNTSQRYVSTDVCSSESRTLSYAANENSADMVYRDEENNYVIGPEVTLSDTQTVWTGDAGTLCLEYGRRNDPNSLIVAGNKVDCIVKPVQQLYDESNGLNLTRQQIIDRVFACRSADAPSDPSQPDTGVNVRCANGDIANKAGLQTGSCDVNNYYSYCYQYNFSPTASKEAQINRRIDKGVASFATVPTIQVPGMYDALYIQYVRLQKLLSASNRQIIFKENIGMKFDVSTLIRDANRPFNKENYWYTQKVTDETGSSTQCSVPATMNNEYYLAKADPTYTTYQYFDWLGYLDILQEMYMAYAKSEGLPDISTVENPYYSGVSKTSTNVSSSSPTINMEEIPTEYLDEAKKLTANSFIMTSDLASQIISFPLMTCDEMLGMKYDSTLPVTSKIPYDKNLTCLTFADDPRFQLEDDLGNFLCSRGYQVPGLCDSEAKCAQTLEFLHPLMSDVRITQSYKARPTKHNGIDYGVPIGTPVYAAKEGKVIKAVGAFDNVHDNCFGKSSSSTLPPINDDPDVEIRARMLLIGCEEWDPVTLVCTKFREKEEPVVPPIDEDAPLDSGGQSLDGILSTSNEILAQDTSQTSDSSPYSDCFSRTSGYANYVEIEHDINGKKYYTIYAHLTSVSVAEGDTVVAGQQIGTSGNTGNSTGPHLHFELRHTDCSDYPSTISLGTCTLDPQPLIKLNLSDFQCVNCVQEPDDPVCKEKEREENKSDINDIVATKKYESLDCLIADVASFVSSNYRDGIPAEMIKATMFLETGWLKHEGGEFTGDPSIIDRYEPDAYIMGPFQFSKGAWNYFNIDNDPKKTLFVRNKEQLIACIDHIGLTNVGELNYDHRAVLGIAMCASAIKSINDVYNHSNLPYQGADENPEPYKNLVINNLGEEYYDTVMGSFFKPASEWGEMQAKIVAFHNLGACTDPDEGPFYLLNIDTGEFETDDYCEYVWYLFQEFRNDFESLQCKDITVTTSSGGESVTHKVETYTGDIRFFPVSEDRKIPECQEPDPDSLTTIIEKLPAALPYFAGGSSALSDTSGFKLDNDAAADLVAMMRSMYLSDQVAYNSCGFNWGYRSSATQASFGACRSDHTACACYSEHQLATTVDFRKNNGDAVNLFSVSDCATWLRNNASNYGFIQSYTKGTPDFVTEPWHYRWIGRTKAADFVSKLDQYKYLRFYLESLENN